ncbi:MAG: hypothetical protein PHO66_08065, partial [Eubacteriales bacterium]|nr:hypothetical protein [Eubacteriales bacterium]
MIEIRDVLRRHATQYPAMQCEDLVKLVYQNEFGGGHMIADPQSSLRYLEEEYAGVHQDAGCALADDIGNGRVRLHLRALQAAGLTLPTVNRFFVHSANRAHGSMQAFARKLDTA